MQFSLEQRGAVRIVRVKEPRFTYPVLAPFIAEIRRLVEQGARQVIIDLATVTYIDSASIGCLIEVKQLVTDRAGSLMVSGPKPRVHTMLSMVMVDRILDVHATEAEALRAFGVRGLGDRVRRARGRRGKLRTPGRSAT